MELDKTLTRTDVVRKELRVPGPVHEQIIEPRLTPAQQLACWLEGAIEILAGGSRSTATYFLYKIRPAPDRDTPHRDFTRGWGLFVSNNNVQVGDRLFFAWPANQGWLRLRVEHEAPNPAQPMLMMLAPPPHVAADPMVVAPNHQEDAGDVFVAGPAAFGGLPDPDIPPSAEQDPEKLQRLLPEIPPWVKNPDYDRMDWLKKFVAQMLTFLKKAICTAAKDIATPIFAEQIPNYKIDSVQVKTFILGSLPPTFQGMKVYIADENELIVEPSLKWAENPNVVFSVKAFGLWATAQVVARQVFRVTLKPLVPSFPRFVNIYVSLMEKKKPDATKWQIPFFHHDQLFSKDRATGELSTTAKEKKLKSLGESRADKQEESIGEQAQPSDSSDSSNLTKGKEKRSWFAYTSVVDVPVVIQERADVRYFQIDD